MLLLWIALSGAVLAAAGRSWSLDAQRQREAELAFRGRQIAQAIAAYAAPLNVNGCANLVEYPRQLAELLEDRRCGLMRRHLRRLYDDPIGRSPQWGLVIVDERIRGVHSRSTAAVLRKVEGAPTYDAWVFMGEDMARPVAAPGSGGEDPNGAGAGAGDGAGPGGAASGDGSGARGGSSGGSSGGPPGSLPRTTPAR